jgi:hypothetical protein
MTREDWKIFLDFADKHLVPKAPPPRAIEQKVEFKLPR